MRIAITGFERMSQSMSVETNGNVLTIGWNYTLEGERYLSIEIEDESPKYLGGEKENKFYAEFCITPKQWEDILSMLGTHTVTHD